MKEPKRLFEDGSPFERSLLASGRTDDLSGGLEQKILAALAASPRAEAAELSNPPREREREREPGNLTRFLRPRAILGAIAVIALGAAVIGSIGGRKQAPAPVIPRPPVVREADPAPPAPAKDDRPRATEVVVTPDSLPTAPSPASTAVRVAAPAASAAALAVGTADTGASLEREIELLDGVKAKLGAGSAAEAARALDAYDAEFPRGALRPEGTVLRVRVLLLQGDRAAANKLADELLAAHPGSVHGKRMRALLAE